MRMALYFICDTNNDLKREIYPKDPLNDQRFRVTKLDVFRSMFLLD